MGKSNNTETTAVTETTADADAVVYTPVVEAFISADEAREAWRGTPESLIRAHRAFRAFARKYKVKSDRKTLRPPALAAVLLADSRFIPGGGVPGGEIGALLMAAGYVGREKGRHVTSWPAHMRALIEHTWTHEVLGDLPCVEAVTDPVAAEAKRKRNEAAGRKNSGRNPVMYRPVSPEALEALQALAKS